MHLIMLLVALSIALMVRSANLQSTDIWLESWQRSLFKFLFPPLLLLATAVAVLYMGCQGTMLGIKASWSGYSIAVGFIAYAVVMLLKLAYQGYQTGQKISRYPLQLIAGKTARVFACDLPYSAQIGFWHSQLVVSQGLIDTLDPEHLEAVLAHEQAHVYYRDTFWFFWLGWLRSLTFWLPNTEALWQELLLLREIRADYTAAKIVDPLLIAESLITVAQAPLKRETYLAATFSCKVTRSRLEERIEQLLGGQKSNRANGWSWNIWLLLLLVPFWAIPFHY